MRKKIFAGDVINIISCFQTTTPHGTFSFQFNRFDVLKKLTQVRFLISMCIPNGRFVLASFFKVTNSVNVFTCTIPNPDDTFLKTHLVHKA